jgi:hypothetical protein
MVISLRVFVRMLRTKIDMLKVRQLHVAFLHFVW